MKNKVLKKLVTFVVMAAIVFTMAMPTFAARPYKDVYNNKNVGSFTYKAIKYLKKHHAFDGVVKGKKFYPDKTITVKDCLKIFINLYGKKNVPISKADRANYKKKARLRWFAKKIKAVSKKLGGGTVNWYPPLNLRLTRGIAACEIYGYLVYDFKLKPRR